MQDIGRLTGRIVTVGRLRPVRQREARDEAVRQITSHSQHAISIAHIGQVADEIVGCLADSH